MTEVEIQNRLNEIQAVSLQSLDDEAVLKLLAERKELLAKQVELQKQAEADRQAEAKRKEEEERLAKVAQEKEWQEKHQALVGQLAEVNKSITPDQPSEKLMALIQERKVLEAQLEVFEATESKEVVASVKAPVAPVVAPPQEEQELAPASEPESVPEPEEELSVKEEFVEPVVAPEPISVTEPEKNLEVVGEEKITIKPSALYTETNHISGQGKVSELEASEGRVALDNSLQSLEFQGYLSELKANLNSLGTFLQELPAEVKRNRSFMLQVATIDPAYAMHYADKDTLKKDETFNVTVAGMNNQRNTGNPLSEMLPEMRTGAVLVAGVKNDFRNVRFIHPEMPEYDEIIALAKKGALEAVSSLKDAHDLKFLLPPILQKDKAFMEEVQKLVK